MIEFAQAWGILAAALPRARPPEVVALADAVGRRAAEPLRAPTDLPGFHRASMDGFAIRAADTHSASPARFELVGKVAAGDPPATSVSFGEAVAISTGAEVPPGADAILRSEHAEVDGDVLTQTAGGPLESGTFVRRRAEDVTAGDALLAAGDRVTLGRLAALAASGVTGLTVFTRARVALVITGSELASPGAELGLGQIHDANGPLLVELVARTGAELVGVFRAADDRKAIRRAIRSAMQTADLVLISGGVSVGPHDHVRPALEEEHVETLFWRVRMKPGKPLYAGRRDGVIVLGLPGNPLSAIVGFLAFAEPALARLQGERDATLRTVSARLAAPAAPQDGRTTFLAASLTRDPHDGTLLATPARHQGSHRVGGLASADGFVVVAHDGGELAPGSWAEVVAL